MVLTKKLPEIERGLQWHALCENIERFQSIQTWSQVIWKFSPMTTIKVNIYGSFIKESGGAGIWGIVRDNKGELIMALSIQLLVQATT